jgi:hypothetical protein
MAFEAVSGQQWSDLVVEIDRFIRSMDRETDTCRTQNDSPDRSDEEKVNSHLDVLSQSLSQSWHSLPADSRFIVT